jgi:prepilin-type N-terminal cleavage/methylation domain-containing protein
MNSAPSSGSRNKALCPIWVTRVKPASLPNEAAFTLIELLVVIAIIAILASLLLPVINRAKSKAQGIQCLSNLKNFALAWTMYNAENGERVPPNDCCDDPTLGVWVNTWVHGWTYLGANRPDDTNTLFLTGSLLGPYLSRSIPVWHCPSDKSTSRWGGKELPRVRTVSMNSWLNAVEDADQLDSGHLAAGRMMKSTADMTGPGPSDILVFTDERADSINDGYFAIEMWATNRLALIGDVPGSYHNRAGTFSFADTHAELHKWLDPRTTPPLQKSYTALYAIGANSPNNADIDWLQRHATVRTR